MDIQTIQERLTRTGFAPCAHCGGFVDNIEFWTHPMYPDEDGVWFDIVAPSPCPHCGEELHYFHVLSENKEGE